VLPNIASTLIVAATLSFPEIVLLESGLSFLGLGVQPPMTSLGNMVGYGREYLTRAPWILLAPSTTIVLTTLSVSLLGDWLRDRLDPTLTRPPSSHPIAAARWSGPRTARRRSAIPRRCRWSRWSSTSTPPPTARS
jgi:hypothetical protein